MLTAIKGVIQGNTVLVDENEIKPFDGKSVTLIINDDVKRNSTGI